MLESRRIGTELHGEPYRRALPGYPPRTGMGGGQSDSATLPRGDGSADGVSSPIFHMEEARLNLAQQTCRLHSRVWDGEASAVPVSATA